MSVSTSLILTTKNGNKIKTQNITYANPNAADSDLSTFMASFCSLSKNEFVSLNRVDKHELTMPEPEVEPDLIAQPNMVPLMLMNVDQPVTVSFDAPGVDRFDNLHVAGEAENANYKIIITGTTPPVALFFRQNSATAGWATPAVFEATGYKGSEEIELTCTVTVTIVNG